MRHSVDTLSESALLGEVAQLAQQVREIGDEVARMPQERDCGVEDVLSEPAGLQGRLNSKAAQLSGVRISPTTASKRLLKHRGRPATSYFWLGSLLSLFVPCFVDGVTAWSVTWWLLIVRGFQA